MLAFVWVLTLLLLALWSLTAWGLYALLSVDPAWVGDLKPLIDRVPYGELIEQWVPGWQALLHLGVDLTQAVLGALGGASGWVVGIAWGAGALLLVGGAALVSLVIGLLRRKAAPGGAAGANA